MAILGQRRGVALELGVLDVNRTIVGESQSVTG